MRAVENAPIAEDPSLEVTGLELELAQKVKIIEGGKLVIPAAMRRALGIARGDTVVVELLPRGELRVRPLSAAVREAQAIVRKAVQGHRSLAEELMRERKQDAISE